MEILVAIGVGFLQLGATGAIFISFAAPERAPFGLGEIPAGWRLIVLFCVSILSGIVIQLAGVYHRLH